MSVLALPTAYWHSWWRVYGRRVQIPASVRLVIIGGEAPRPDCVAGWPLLAPGATLVNTYGPTEATVVATAWTQPAPPATASLTARAPLGDGMPGVRVRVVGRHLDAAAVGVAAPLMAAVAWRSVSERPPSHRRALSADRRGDTWRAVRSDPAKRPESALRLLEFLASGLAR